MIKELFDFDVNLILVTGINVNGVHTYRFRGMNEC